MQSKRACVHRGKEILPEKGDEQPGGDAKREKSNREGPSVSQHGAQQVRISLSEAIERLFKTLLKGDQWPDPKRYVLFACLFVVMALEPHDHCRHQRARKYIRRDYSEHHGFGQRHKEIARHAGQRKHGDKDNTDTES